MCSEVYRLNVRNRYDGRLQNDLMFLDENVLNFVLGRKDPFNFRHGLNI